jgi:glycosyltransferase involved in cell wall biosynthesis
MKQLHVVMDLSIRSGGQARAAIQYAQANASAGADITLYVVNPTDDTLETIPASGAFRVVYARGLKAIHLFRCVERGAFNVVHLHGTWSPMLAVASLMARACGLPYLVSPHGCLEPWAINHRRAKKLIALALYQKHVFCKAAMLLATAEQELRSIRRLGINTPVAVIPLGVDLPDASTPRIELAKRILFMSRIHPVKGLIELVSAWALVRQPGWTVVIAGPDEDGHEAAVRAQIQILGLEDDFHFTGLVAGDQKEQLFATCDFFILPSHSENFGMVVAEALARSLPVITTTGTPWQLLQPRGCGWWVSPDVDGLALALRQALNMSKSELNQMGAHGRELVTQEFAWEKIGKMAFEAIDWVLNKSAPVPQIINVGESP